MNMVIVSLGLFGLVLLAARVMFHLLDKEYQWAVIEIMLFAFLLSLIKLVIGG
jgi:hypothetical protein